LGDVSMVKCKVLLTCGIFLMTALIPMTAFLMNLETVEAKVAPDLTPTNLNCKEEDGATNLYFNIKNKGSADYDGEAIWIYGYFTKWFDGKVETGYWFQTPLDTNEVSDQQRMTTGGTGFDCCHVKVDDNDDVDEMDEDNNYKNDNTVEDYMSDGEHSIVRVPITNPEPITLTFQSSFEVVPDIVAPHWNIAILPPILQVPAHTTALVEVYIQAPQTIDIYPDIIITSENYPHYGYNQINIIHLRAPGIADIKPDTLNVKSKGKWIKAEFQIGEEYDINNIDYDSITLQVATNTLAKEIHIVPDAPRSIITIKGIPTLIVKFDRQEVISELHPGDSATFVLKARLLDGTPFMGEDTVKIVGR
jgi:hypothetical protein